MTKKVKILCVYCWKRFKVGVEFCHPPYVKVLKYDGHILGQCNVCNPAKELPKYD